jgi:hypothetical protein
VKMRAAGFALVVVEMVTIAGCSKDTPKVTETDALPPIGSESAGAASAGAGASGSAGAPGSDSAGAGESASTTPPAAQQLPLASLKLLDPGAAPRRKLRYAWHADQKEQMSMTLTTAASTEMAGVKQPEIPLPPVHITIAIDPRGVTPDGDLRYAWRITGATVTVDAQTPSQVGDGMKAEVAVIEHLSGTGAITAQGLSRELTIDNASIADGGTGQMVEQVRQQLRDVAAPLPDEEVGKGGKWQKLSTLEAREAKLTQTDTYTLNELREDGGTLDDVLAQTAPSQKLRAVGMPAGQQARMDSMLASGDSKVKFDLSRLVPQTKFDGTASMVISGDAPADRSRKMMMVMRVGIGITGTLR